MTPLQDEIDRAKQILDDAVAEFEPVAIFAGFSGGYDSLVCTHFTVNHESSVRPLHLNTGIGIEKTREFVRRTCGEYGWNLREEVTRESYEDLVLGRVVGYPGGFPGPAMHGVMYQRLKERPLAAVIRGIKAGLPTKGKQKARVMIVTGIRHDESKVRSGYKRAVSRVDAQVWVNPFYYATLDHFRMYRKVFALPSNPVKDRTGLSGECLCGAHSSTGEIVRIRAACPATADYLDDLQCRVRSAGFPWGYEEGPPKWFMDQKRGQGMLGDWFGDEPGVGPMCHSCEKFSSLMHPEPLLESPR